MPTPEDIAFAQKYPTLAFQRATSGEGKAPLPSNPVDTAAVRRAPTPTRTPVFSEETVRGLTAPVKPFTAGSTAQDYQNFSQPMQNAQTDILRGLTKLYAEADDLQAFDEDIVRKRMIADLEPFTDIDARVKAITKDGLVQKALLSEKYRDLPPSMRRSAVAQELKGHSDAIDNLLAIRQKREDKINLQVAEQVAGMQRREKALTTRQELLGKMGDYLEGVGASREELAMAEMTRLKAQDEMERLRRKMAGGGVPTRIGEVTGAFKPEEVQAFSLLAAREAEGDITDHADLMSVVKDEFGLSGGKLSNFASRYDQWKDERSKNTSSASTPASAGGTTFSTDPVNLRLNAPGLVTLN